MQQMGPGPMPNRNQQWRGPSVPTPMNNQGWPNQGGPMQGGPMASNPYQNTHVRQHLNTLISNRQTPIMQQPGGYPGQNQGYPQNSMQQAYRNNAPVNQEYSLVDSY